MLAREANCFQQEVRASYLLLPLAPSSKMFEFQRLLLLCYGASLCLQVRVHKSAVKYFSSQQEGGAELESERAKWEGQLSRLLGEHPETRDEISSDSDSSQQLSLDSDPPPSLPSTSE